MIEDANAKINIKSVFPTLEGNVVSGMGARYLTTGGLTRLELFAAIAMHGLLTSPGLEPSKYMDANMKVAVFIAKCIEEELDKPQCTRDEMIRAYQAERVQSGAQSSIFRKVLRRIFGAGKKGGGTQ